MKRPIQIIHLPQAPRADGISRLGDLLNHSVPRGVGLFLGGFCLLNLLGGLRTAGFDANLWWIDVRVFPEACVWPFLFVSALCLIGFGLRPPGSVWRRRLTIGCAGLLGLLGLGNCAQFYWLLAHGRVSAGFPVPLSLVVAAGLWMIVAAGLRPVRREHGWGAPVQAAVVCLACAAVFPLLQMVCFGKTSYQRLADVAVVFGARVYADGRPSDALADRVRTACALYRNGTVKKLIFSGGPGDGAVHETESMRRMAVQLGVKPEDILVDTAGVNTQATIRNTGPMFRALGARRILVVSHFYHLPRIKLAYQRSGCEVYTVPARESYLLRQMPYNMAREVAALWVYYFRPLGAA